MACPSKPATTQCPSTPAGSQCPSSPAGSQCPSTPAGSQCPCTPADKNPKTDEINVTYVVNFNSNGGSESGTPSPQKKTHGVVINLSIARPYRQGHKFMGWATNSTATSASYQPGGTYSANASVILYAVWKAIKIYLSPSDQHSNAWRHYHYNEAEKMLELSKKIRTVLQSYGYEVYGCQNHLYDDLNNDGKFTEGIKEGVTYRIRESNNVGSDVHIALHSNGTFPNPPTNKPGPETHYLINNSKSDKSKESKELATRIQNKLFNFYNSCRESSQYDRGIQTIQWDELTQSNAIPAYIEVAFHDVEKDEEWIINNGDTIATKIADGIREYTNLFLN